MKIWSLYCHEDILNPALPLPQTLKATQMIWRVFSGPGGSSGRLYEQDFKAVQPDKLQLVRPPIITMEYKLALFIYMVWNLICWGVLIHDFHLESIPPVLHHSAFPWLSHMITGIDTEIPSVVSGVHILSLVLCLMGKACQNYPFFPILSAL